MTIVYQIELKQRGGKWAPQCERDTVESARQTFGQMQSMRRKLRVCKIENGTRTVIAKYEPPTMKALS